MAQPRSRQTLTRARIVAAALDLVDERGVESLSLRKLGRALGVEAMAIYFHFDTKRDLLATAGDTLRARVSLPSRDASSPRASFAAAARSLRDLAAAHPRAIELVLARLGEDGPRAEWNAAALDALAVSHEAPGASAQATCDLAFHLACGVARDVANAHARHAGAKERAAADARAQAALEQGLSALFGAKGAAGS
jgi:AcrR family transcriptional regulator